MGTTNKVKK